LLGCEHEGALFLTTPSIWIGLDRYSKLYPHMGMRSSNSEPRPGWFS
jgi:hypothetical protein